MRLALISLVKIDTGARDAGDVINEAFARQRIHSFGEIRCIAHECPRGRDAQFNAPGSGNQFIDPVSFGSARFRNVSLLNQRRQFLFHRTAVRVGASVKLVQNVLPLDFETYALHGEGKNTMNG
jgi:hypothetical protein